MAYSDRLGSLNRKIRRSKELAERLKEGRGSYEDYLRLRREIVNSKLE